LPEDGAEVNRLAGRIALVTGASRGIGRAVAELFLEEGAKVALLARSATSIEHLADAYNQKTRRALALACDVTSREEVARALDELEASWGSLQILVNNAGVSGRTPMEEPDDDTWTRIVETNLTGTYLVTRRALGLMGSGGGRILNMSSVLGHEGAAGYAAYCVTKHGLLGFTRALALELAPRHITVNAICPGWVETDMAERGLADTAAALGISKEDYRDREIEATPVKRFLKPEEVAKLALYLASDDASGITGQTYNI
jgi:NAD(P)-dependent dehydrogenase (short-subunit alcohol dehydrogenase family)